MLKHPVAKCYGAVDLMGVETALKKGRERERKKKRHTVNLASWKVLAVKAMSGDVSLSG